eukprot:TRINITY_DN2892_c0_g1_i1.p1 TRINITY_DN2892_c0_g1~~TRINITY_DN2892_c0_g1_i1.p1  ORF type:complete len:312 (+),score=80.57 TRINITY_DN2892_c0_g1_i1:49-984(+)
MWRRVVALVMAVVVAVAVSPRRQAQGNNNNKNKNNKNNERPIVGVLSAPFDEADATQGSFFRQTYVQWLEQSGTRVVPIMYDSPVGELHRLWSSINGILLTGGSLSLLPNTTYYQTAQYLYNLTIAANTAGDHFPIWGTCMGMQLLCLLASNNNSVLSRYAFDSENLPLPLDFTSAASSSYLFSDAPPEIYLAFSTEEAVVSTQSTGTNKDRVGKAFLSTIEGIKAPLYGVQWHPERNQFYWSLDEDTDHSTAAMACMSYISQRFVESTRTNWHKFATQAEEEAALIYRWTPVFDGNSTVTYEFPPFGKLP